MKRFYSCREKKINGENKREIEFVVVYLITLLHPTAQAFSYSRRGCHTWDVTNNLLVTAHPGCYKSRLRLNTHIVHKSI